MNADGSNPTRLTNDPEDETWPSWSPDGTKIAFQSQSEGENEVIYVMNADGSEQTNISGGRFGIDPDWGPAVDTD
jgi:Tol biopolymer transport system component